MNIKKASYIFSFATILTVIVLTIIVLSKDKVSDQPQQEISGMLMQEQMDLNVENLALLCKIWGFMKYYHPEVRAGKYDWDKELFSIIPSFNCISSKEKQNEILTEWVNKFDVPMEPGEKIIFSSDSIKMYPDINWIEDTVTLGTKLSGTLKKIYDAKRDTFSYYATPGGPNYKIFKHEKSYPECIFPNTNYQLLSLFRFWNAIQYYSPYKYLLKKDWNETLVEYIPLFLGITNRNDYENILTRFAAELHDSHAVITGKNNTKRYMIPVLVRFIEGKAVVSEYHGPKSSLQESPDSILQVGDILLLINNEPIDSLIMRATPYTSGSNKTSLLRNIAYELLQSSEDQLYVTYERNGIVNNRKIKCILKGRINLAISQKSRPLTTILPSDILYLYMGSSIGEKVPQEIKEKGVIIDLRSYPHKNIEGYWEYEYLYPNSTEFAILTVGSITHPGLFTFKEIVKTGKNNKNYYRGPKVILVNEITQSQAEYMTMKYRCSPNTIVMGSQTAGADGNIIFTRLPGNLCAIFTGLGVYYPDKSETQQIGIVPDIEVKSTIQGIREGRDEVLEAAIDYINKKVATSGTSK